MPSPVPLATYRLQLTSEFAFKDAAAIIPYLKKLGISHVYVSPILKARHGSTHGYDVVDHSEINPELGGDAGFAQFSTALKRHDLGLILDFVPNHMGVHFDDNAWWLDVLEWGPQSPFANSFDIDWDMLPFRTKPGLLLPILGASYGEALGKGEIELRFDAAAGSFSAWYFEHRLPIAPERYSDILRRVVDHGSAAQTEIGAALLAIAQRYTGPRNPDRKTAPALKRQLADLTAAHGLITSGLAAYRAGSGEAATLALHHLLERQHYRLAHWRLATSEINYRRFFDVNTLAGLRIEDRGTFERVHALVKQLIADDRIQGLRLDHIDGLRDPAQYFSRLRRLIREAKGEGRQGHLYLLIEKIVGEQEELPRFTGVDGTTGYEWLNVITQVLLDSEGLKELNEIWRQASNTTPSFDTVLRDSKRRVLETLLASEFTVLVRLLARIAAGHYSTRDYSQDSLRQALQLYVLHFPVYRTYLTANGPSDRDRALIEATIAAARAEWFAADSGILDFLRDALTLDLIARDPPLHSKPRVVRFASKLQQFTGPLMAKSMEDTAFYRFARLLALNEVGGNPESAGVPLEAFHAVMTARAAQWPHGLTATATHDTKRGEDSRMRIASLSELTSDWAHAVGHWKTLNARFIASHGTQRSPDIADEYFIYQTLIGALPFGAVTGDFVERLQAYLLKALREAKLHTSWLNPQDAYERGVADFIRNILDQDSNAEFIASLRAFASRTALIGALNSLTQLTLKATLPGVPDFYQGTELWDFSFVDPDNRRKVDFGVRERLAGESNDGRPMLSRDWQSGRIKFAWTQHLLQLRQTASDAFTNGAYAPLTVTGSDSRHVIAFSRRSKSTAALVVALRCFAPFTDGGRHWPSFDSIDAQIALSPFRLLNHDSAIAEEGPTKLGAILRDCPAAVLLAEPGGRTPRHH